MLNLPRNREAERLRSLEIDYKFKPGTKPTYYLTASNLSVARPSIEKIVYKAAQPDETTITCRSGIVHGKYIERLDFDRTVTDQQSKVSRIRASQTFRHGCYQICMADGCERLEEQRNACDNVT